MSANRVAALGEGAGMVDRVMGEIDGMIAAVERHVATTAEGDYPNVPSGLKAKVAGIFVPTRPTVAPTHLDCDGTASPQLSVDIQGGTTVGRVMATVDTGSAITMITRKMVDMLGLRLYPARGVFHVANDSSVCINHSVNVDLILDGKIGVRIEGVAVQEGDFTLMLLGTDILYGNPALYQPCWIGMSGVMSLKVIQQGWKGKNVVRLALRVPETFRQSQGSGDDGVENLPSPPPNTPPAPPAAKGKSLTGNPALRAFPVGVLKTMQELCQRREEMKKVFSAEGFTAIKSDLGKLVHRMQLK